MFRVARTALAAIALVLCAAGTASAADDAELQKKKDLLKRVSEKLLAVCEPVPGMEWPPDIALDPGADINAYATVIFKDNKVFPIVRVYDGMMTKIIKGDADRLAFILGHELAHITKRHVLMQKGKTAVLKIAFTRDQEVEADLAGVEYLLAAGYSLPKGIKAITEMQALGLEYSSFEGLGVDHPSWNDRLAKMDKDKAHLWKAMSAFKN